jgi:hypothetical protein
MRATKLCGLGAVLFVGSVLVAGCGMEIKYKPQSAASAPLTSNVALKVEDQRPLDHGGQSKTHVGNVRSAVGIPSRMNDKHPDVAPHTVTDATSDALRHIGVGVAGGPKTLVATIKEFWMDGYMGYKCTVVVNYQLVDASGKAVWAAEVKGASGGTDVFGSPQSTTMRLFQNALSDLAQNASEQFKAAPFQQALAAN